MKRIISLIFLIFSFTLFSQSEKVNFENELTYKMSEREHHIIWYVSNKYPAIELVRDTYPYDYQNSLYYLGKASYYSLNENNEIEYDKLEFQDEIIHRAVEITKSEKTEVINGFKCETFIIDSNNQRYEVFISNDSKINNIGYLNGLVGINSFVGKNDNPIKSGFIVKISVYSPWYDEYRTQLELSDIKKSNKSIFVDFEKLNSRLNKPQKYPMIESEVVEPVENKR